MNRKSNIPHAAWVAGALCLAGCGSPSTSLDGDPPRIAGRIEHIGGDQKMPWTLTGYRIETNLGPEGTGAISASGDFDLSVPASSDLIRYIGPVTGRFRDCSQQPMVDPPNAQKYIFTFPLRKEGSSRSVGEAFLDHREPDWVVNLIYVDRDTRISGRAYCGDPEVSSFDTTYNMDLKKGYNLELTRKLSDSPNHVWEISSSRTIGPDISWYANPR